MNQNVYREYLAILREEIVPALGCTEPIAIAYAAAKARSVLGRLPEHIDVRCSGNIIKNVKAVIVPTTGNMKGIETSAVLGAVGGNPDKKLEVLTDVSPKDLELTWELLRKKICSVSLLEGVSNLQIIVEMTAGQESALVEIAFSHTNIVRIEHNGTVVMKKGMSAQNATETDRSLLNLHDIYDFANTVDIAEVGGLMEDQVRCNMAIAREGLSNKYGANVGSTILEHYGRDARTMARALPAAGSDARMNGCVLPVMINSGSGNQGMTVSLPVQVFADALGVSREKKIRALVLSNLIAIYQKNELGKLSAYCGAVSAAVGAGAAIAYLHNADFDVIEGTIVNTLGNPHQRQGRPRCPLPHPARPHRGVGCGDQRPADTGLPRDEPRKRSGHFHLHHPCWRGQQHRARQRGDDRHSPHPEPGGSRPHGGQREARGCLGG